MTRRLVLHIGTTKTGSTAIQNTLAQRRRALGEQGVYVQNRPAKASHSLLPASMLGTLTAAPGRAHPMWGGLSPKTRIETFRREFSAEMDSLTGSVHTCIISSEHLSAWLQTDDEVQRLAALLRPYFPQISVIVYLRRQDQHVGSFYNEVLKSGIIPKADLPDAPETLNSLDYAALLARYARAFGQAAIKPRIFEKDCLLSSNVVADFFSVAGIDPGSAEQAASNQSINLTGQTLLGDAIRRFGSTGSSSHLNTRPEWRLVTQAVELQCRGTGWRPAASAARTFMQAFEQSNEAVRSLYFPDRAHLFSTVYDDPGSEQAPTTEARLEACMDVMFRLARMQSEREAHWAMVQYKLMSRLEDQAGMREMLRQALRHAPDNIAARHRMAELSMADGRTAEALDHLEAILRTDPHNKEAIRRKTLWSRQKRDGVIPAGKTAAPHPDPDSSSRH